MMYLFQPCTLCHNQHYHVPKCNSEQPAGLQDWLHVGWSLKGREIQLVQKGDNKQPSYIYLKWNLCRFEWWLWKVMLFLHETVQLQSVWIYGVVMYSNGNPASWWGKSIKMPPTKLNYQKYSSSIMPLLTANLYAQYIPNSNFLLNVFMHV